MRKSIVAYFSVFFVAVSLVLLYAGFSVLGSIYSFREMLKDTSFIGPITGPPSLLIGYKLIGAGIGLLILGVVFPLLARRRLS